MADDGWRAALGDARVLVRLARRIVRDALVRVS